MHSMINLQLSGERVKWKRQNPRASEKHRGFICLNFWLLSSSRGVSKDKSNYPEYSDQLHLFKVFSAGYNLEVWSTALLQKLDAKTVTSCKSLSQLILHRVILAKL